MFAKTFEAKLDLDLLDHIINKLTTDLLFIKALVPNHPLQVVASIWY
jgi:hypothetical protein